MASSPSSSSLNNKSPRGQPSPQVNRDHTTLANSLNRLAISSASPTSLPPSPASASRSREQRFPSSPDVSRTQRSPFNRSPSSMSIDPRSSTPTLLRKASMNSMHGVGGVTPSRSSSRRSSSTQLLAASPAPMSGSPLSGKGTPPPAPPRHTATSIASAHFKTELDLHQNEEERSADTIVILHDSCYGHRYSRPRTSRAALSTIVERPERIHASILGLSVAYVRLGDRHGEGQYPLHPSRDAASIPTIPFRIRKTTRKLPLSSPAVTNVHGTKWMEELRIMCDGAEAKLAQNGKELTRPEMPRSPDQETPSKFHEGDLYLCADSLDAMEGALGAVCEGVDAIFQGSATHKGPHRAFVAIRPPGHHCSASYPSGFCWLNNIHVGITHAALNHGLTHAAIIDFDLHHGDGSQSITWDHNTRAKNSAKNAAAWKKTSIGYFSLHDINSYPCEMGDADKVKNASLCIENAHGQSIWNVHLQPWKSEAEFWELYETKYSVLLEKARNYLRVQTERLRASPNLPKPKGAIFLSAGFDASEWESAGMQRHKVNVPTEFYARLTRDVVKLAAEEGSAVDGRVISVLEGGYSDRALCTGVFSHISGLAGGDPIAVKKEKDHTGLNYEMGQKIGMFDGVVSPEKPVFPGTRPYDPNWWSLPKLEQLDAVMNPVAPSPEPKQPKNTTPPTYSSPTQSFTAKIVDTQFRRSMSRSTSTMSVHSGSPRAVSRPPTPPPPEVHWTVASHELSKLLIPTERQTFSCKPEDLSAEATRARRDRQSILMPVAEAPAVTSASNTRMALRERKPAKPMFDSAEDDKPKASRRKTVVGAAVLAAEKAISRSITPKPDLPTSTEHTNQASQRISVASNIGSVISDSTSSRPSSRVPSNGSSTMPKRPDTSQSIRPESSMSSYGSVVVKKTRAPAQPRGDTVKPSRSRKKSPLGSSDALQEPHPRPESVALSNTDTILSHTSDMDSLTAGMRKIKINLTTKAQREAREAKEAKEAKDQSKPIVKASATKTLAKAAPKKPAKARQTEEQVQEAPEPAMQSIELQSNGSPFVPVTSPGPVADMLSQPSALQPTIISSIPSGLEKKEDTLQLPPTQIPPHVIPHASLGSSPSDPDFSNPVPRSYIPSQVPLSANSRSDPVSSRHIPNHSPSGQSNTGINTDIFVQYQPEGPPASTIPHSGEPLRWLPPNTATPAATPGQTPAKRDNMPIFTATSAIPFGANPNPNGAPKNTENQESKPN